MAARFFSLTDLIQQQIAQNVQDLQAPVGTPLSVSLGDQPLDSNAPSEVYSDFRWGYSVWGIDTITGQSTPQG